MLLSVLTVFVIVALILCALRVFYVFRAGAMRALAARWGLRYVGPPTPPQWWFNPSHPKISLPLPGWLSEFYPSGRRLTQVWNVIEGRRNGLSFLIFDGLVGDRRSGPCTLIACQTETNPFATPRGRDHVVQSHGWTVLHGAHLVCWTMGTKRLDSYVKDLLVPRLSRPNS
jgi:hypothetical protein